ncbi:unnamed protein product [Protopolystoma xenopodis]|uniref:SH3 domain-containing protein n=1 Tax=Protopolystoma xenopodis TaxID=117903 RepID=A0A3S5A0T7_9PLAT|nr:unnamed protein product [Protopolystoma xenopodis]
MAPSGPGVRMVYPGGPVTSGQPPRPDVPHAASLATDILPNGYQQQLVNQQMSQIKQDQHFHHHQQIQQNQQQHQPQKSFQQSQQAQMTGASGSALDRRNQVRRMIALHDYDPHVLSPNVDVEQAGLPIHFHFIQLHHFIVLQAELAFRAGDVILVHGEMDEDGFYTGETVTGQRGLVPSNFLQELPKQQSREQTYPQHCLQQQPEPQLQQIRPLLQQPDTQARGSIVAATRDIRNRPVGPRGPPATGYQSTGKSVRPVAPQIVGARPQARTGQSGGPRGMTQTDGGANAGTAHSQGARGSRTRPSVT